MVEDAKNRDTPAVSPWRHEEGQQVIERIQLELSERFRVRTSFIPAISVGPSCTIYKAEFLLRTLDEPAMKEACDEILKQEKKHFSAYKISKTYEDQGLSATFIYH